MRAFNIIFTKMRGGLVDGHALRCIENVRTLTIAKRETEQMVRNIESCSTK